MTEPMLPARAGYWLRMLGLLLILLGLAVSAGWLMRIPELTLGVPDLRRMVLNTALCFLLLGQAVRLLPTSSSVKQRQGLTLLVALLCILNLLQLALGQSLGIDLSALHAWADDGNPHPGRMALPTTIGLLLACGSLLLLPGQPRWQKTAGRLLAGALLLLGGFSALGYLLNLEALFGAYPLAGMALETAAGLIILAVALSLAWHWHIAAAETPASSRLLLLATWAPALVALIAGMTGIAIFKSPADQNQLEGLRGAFGAQIERIDTILQLQGAQAWILATQPGLLDDADTAQRELQGFLAHGFSHVELRSPQGAVLFSVGSVGATQLELPFRLREMDGQATLVWTGQGLLLRFRSRIEDGLGAVGMLSSEQPLPTLESLLDATLMDSRSGRLQLCAPEPDRIVCLPTRFSPQAEVLPLHTPDRDNVAPLQLAAAGRRGAGTFRDAAGGLSVSVYAPAGSSGLVSAFVIDAEEINAAIRRQLMLGMLLILLVTALGTSVLRRLIRDQTGELLQVRKQHTLVLDSLQEGVMLMDSKGNILTTNPAAGRIFGLSHDDITDRTIMDPRWQAVREDGSPWPAEDFPANRALRSGKPETDVIMGLRRPDDRLVWLSINTVPAGRDGVVLSLTDITERKRREEYILHAAQHDHLTGLPNRSLLTDRLQQALQASQVGGKTVALLMIDLDHFKRVNDSLGHHVGDQLLVALARRLQASVRTDDTVARMSGDEFVVVLPDARDVARVEHIAQKILETISQVITVGSHELHVTPSIGVSVYPRDGADANALLRNADTAMYQVKGAGRNGVRLFSAEMAHAALDRLQLESALHRALRDGEFRLHYQPQICLRSGQVLGMEALLRWPDPAGGMISPDRFIPVAEESGLMLLIGDWVLRTACRQALALQQQSGKPLQIAVNISPRQFRRPEFVTSLIAILAETGLNPSTLELEITEGLLMEQTDDSIARLHEIRALGVGVAIDDFGVGYASLSYLARFPISTLKIDRCFVSKIPGSASDAAVVHTIIALASSLQMRVIAEGVETAEQLRFLRQHDCHSAQGHYFCPAVPPEQFLTRNQHHRLGAAFEHLGETLPR